MLKVPEAWPTSFGATELNTAFCAAGIADRNASTGDDQRRHERAIGDGGRGDEADPRHAGGLQEQSADDAAAARRSG